MKPNIVDIDDLLGKKPNLNSIEPTKPVKEKKETDDSVVDILSLMGKNSVVPVDRRLQPATMAYRDEIFAKDLPYLPNSKDSGATANLMTLADNATIQEMGWNTFIGGGLNTVAGFMMGLDYDLPGMKDLMEGKERKYGSWLHNMAKSLQEKAQKDYPIYRKPDDGMFNAAYIFDQIKQGGFTVGLIGETLLSDMALTAASEATLGASGYAAAANTARKLRLLKSMTWGGLKGIQEAYINALDTLDQTAQEYEKMGYDKDIAYKRGIQAASLAYKMESAPLMILNALQLGALRAGGAFTKSAGLKSGLGSGIETLAEMIPNKSLQFLGGEVLSEGFEEGLQTWIAKKAAYKTKVSTRDIFTDFDPWDAEMRDSIITGMAFGGIFAGLGKIRNHFENRHIYKTRGKEYDAFVENTAQRVEETQKEIKKAVNEGNHEKAEALSNKVNSDNVLSSIRMDFINKSTSSFDTYLGTLEDSLDAVINLDSEKLKELGLEDEAQQRNVSETYPQLIQQAKELRNNFEFHYNRTGEFSIAASIAQASSALDFVQKKKSNLTVELNDLILKDKYFGQIDETTPNAVEYTKALLEKTALATEMSLDDKKNEVYTKQLQKKFDKAVTEEVKLKEELKKVDPKSLKKVQEAFYLSPKTLQEVIQKHIDRSIYDYLGTQAKEKIKHWSKEKNVRDYTKNKEWHAVENTLSTLELDTLEQELKKVGKLKGKLPELIKAKRETLKAQEADVEKTAENESKAKSLEDIKQRISKQGISNPKINNKSVKEQIIELQKQKQSDFNNIIHHTWEEKGIDEYLVLTSQDSKSPGNIKFKGKTRKEVEEQINAKYNTQRAVIERNNRSNVREMQKEAGIVIEEEAYFDPSVTKENLEDDYNQIIDHLKKYENKPNPTGKDIKAFLQDMNANLNYINDILDVHNNSEEIQSKRKLAELFAKRAQEYSEENEVIEANKEATETENDISKTGDVVKVEKKYKTVDGDLAAAYTSLLYDEVEVTDEDGNVRIEKKDRTLDLYYSPIFDSHIILDPEKFVPGTKMTIKPLRNADSIKIQLWERNANGQITNRGKTVLFGEWKKGKTEEEIAAKIPLGAFIEGNGKPIFSIHDTEWFNSINIDDFEFDYARQDAVIEEGRNNVMQLRNKVNSQGEIQIEITEKKNGYTNYMKDSIPLTENMREEDIVLVYYDGTKSMRSIETGEPINTELGKFTLIDTKMYDAPVMELRKTNNKEEYITYYVLRNPIADNPDVLNTLTALLKARFSKDPNILKSFSLAGFNLESSDDFKKLLNIFINDNVPNILLSQIKSDTRTTDIKILKSLSDYYNKDNYAQDFPFVHSINGKIFFGRNKKLDNNKVNSTIIQNKLTSLLSQGTKFPDAMDQIQIEFGIHYLDSNNVETKLPEFIKFLSEGSIISHTKNGKTVKQNMKILQNTKVGFNKEIPIFDSEGKMLRLQNYYSLLKQTTNTVVKAYNIGTSEKPNYVTMVQPKLKFKIVDKTSNINEDISNPSVKTATSEKNISSNATDTEINSIFEDLKNAGILEQFECKTE